MTEPIETSSRTHVLIVGCGDLGCQLGQLLVADGMQVSGLRRSATPLPTGMLLLQGDVTQAHTLACLVEVKPEILVYCVSADMQSDDNYRAHYVDGLRHVLHAFTVNNVRLRHVFFVSSTRVYGQQHSQQHGQQADALLTEDTPAIPDDFGGRRLLEAECLLADLPCDATVLRLSGIYGPGRERMLHLARQPQAWPQHNRWTNRIHRDDAAAFIAFLIARVLKDEPLDHCYLVTDSCPTPQYELLMMLAEHFGIDTRGIIIPPPAGGRCLSNARMRATGFELRHPDFRSGYAALVA